MRAKRREMPQQEREKRSRRIMEAVAQTEAYSRCELLLVYIAAKAEVETAELIARARSDGKQVACPRCGPSEGEMHFYVVREPEDIEEGSYGIMEPVPSRCEPIDESDTQRALCIVPALACDEDGYRIGYGKGYYDRFLARFRGRSAVVCYESNVVERVPRGEYDRAAEYIVTEEGAKAAKRRT